MKKLSLKRILSVNFFFIVELINCQKLPYEFHFSEDGHRLIRGNTCPTGFYKMESIDTIYLNFSQTDYWSLMTHNYADKTEIQATLRYQGKIYDSVGVRFKGMTSYQRLENSLKKSFNISLDYIKKQDIEGYTTFNLNNNFEDPSRLREFLYSYFCRKHIPSAKANFVIVMINGSSWGIYTNVQQLNKQHVREWFMDADASRWRAESQNGGFAFPPRDGWGPPGGGRPGSGPEPGPGPGPVPGGGGPGFGAGRSSLNYLGEDIKKYQVNYTLKNAYTENSWESLINVCKILNTYEHSVLIDSLNEVLDVDGTLWYLANEILFTDDDGYVNKGGMDYYIYFDIGTNRLVPIEYDGNSTFMVRDATRWSPFYKEENKDLPLMNILFSIPELRQRYLAHIRTILKESFDTNSTNTLIDQYVSLINSYVNDDPKKIYSYSEFKSGIASVKDFIRTRNKYLSSNPEVNKTIPVISSVIFRAGEEDFSLPDEDDRVTVNAIVSHKDGLKAVNLYFGTGIMGGFSKILMYDDGSHNDKLAGDGIYGALLPSYAKGTYVRFYVEAIDASSSGTRSYAPEGAEHDVYIYRVKMADNVSSEIVINEIMPLNSLFPDQNDETDDWIELYNNADYSIDISGYYLSDNGHQLTKWQFPEGTIMEAKGYLTVWADKDTLQQGLHTNFELSGRGEEIFLITPEKLIADAVVYNEQKKELAFARIENGKGSFKWQLPTFHSTNSVITSLFFIQTLSKDLIIYPDQSNSLVHIETDNIQKTGILYIYNILGKTIVSKSFHGETSIDISAFDYGTYFFSLDNYIYRKLVIYPDNTDEVSSQMSMFPFPAMLGIPYANGFEPQPLIFFMSLNNFMR